MTKIPNKNKVFVRARDTRRAKQFLFQFLLDICENLSGVAQQKVFLKFVRSMLITKILLNTNYTISKKNKNKVFVSPGRT